MPSPKPLTAQQAQFLDAYLRSFDGKAAAIAAGYHAKTAATTAQRLLTHPLIRVKVDETLAASARRLEVSTDRVVKELARVGFADIRGIFDASGSLKHPHTLDDDIAAAISSIEVVERPAYDDVGRRTIEYVHKIRLVDKTPALALLCRHLGLLNDKIDLTARLHKAYETAPDQELLDRVKQLLLRAGTLPPILDAETGHPPPPEEPSS